MVHLPSNEAHLPLSFVHCVQGWLGRSDHVLHQGEGTIRAVNWHSSTLVWANEVGIKVRAGKLSVGDSGAAMALFRHTTRDEARWVYAGLCPDHSVCSFMSLGLLCVLLGYAEPSTESVTSTPGNAVRYHLSALCWELRL
jgi:hypothetical protein